MKRRRICILASMGWSVRNVLMSQAMEALRDTCELHVFSTFHHVPAFRERFAHLDGQSELLDPRMRKGVRLIDRWNMMNFYKISPSATHRYKLNRHRPRKKLPPEKRERMSLSGQLVKRSMITAQALIDRATRRFGSSWSFHLSRRVLCECFRYGQRYQMYRDYFKRHRIDTLISTSPLSFPEYPAMVAADDLGLRTMAVIISWDNLSSKRSLLIDFDQYVVWNSIMAGEVESYCKADAKQIHQVGPLQFDYYFDPRYAKSREDYCARFGFDPAKKIVVYSTVTPGLLPDEPKVVQRLLEGLKAGHVHGDPNFMVRLHPKREMAEFQSVADDPRFKGMRVAWTVAGKPVRESSDLWCPMDDEIELLVNTVRHGDVNLNVWSTMMLDFALLGKPAVIVNHNSREKVLHYSQYEHLKPVLALKSHRVSDTFAQTLQYLNDYLDDPDLEADARKELVKLQCGPLVGQGWRLLADAILQPPPRRKPGRRAMLPAARS